MTAMNMHNVTTATIQGADAPYVVLRIRLSSTTVHDCRFDHHKLISQYLVHLICLQGICDRTQVLQQSCSTSHCGVHLEDGVASVGTYDSDDMQLLSGLSPQGLQGVHGTAISLQQIYVSSAVLNCRVNISDCMP